MSKTTQTQNKHWLFSTEVTDYMIQEIKEEYLDEENTEITDEQAYDRALEDIQYSFDDLEYEFENIAKKINNKVIAIADLGLWDGKHMGYKIMEFSDILSVFNEFNDFEIFIEDNDLKAIGYHHDGTNYYTFRLIKDNITDSQLANFECLFLNGEKITKHQISYYTKSLANIIADYFGIVLN